MYGVRWQNGSSSKWHFQGGFSNIQEVNHYIQTNRRCIQRVTWDIMKQNANGEYRVHLSPSNREV